MTAPPSNATTLCVSPEIDTGILDNGDFENGLSPWSVNLVDLFSTSYALVTPGANGSCTAFEVSMESNARTEFLDENLLLLSDVVFSTSGAPLSISFWIRFAQRNAASVTLYANEELVETISAFDYGPGGSSAAVSNPWTLLVIPYTSQDRLLQLSFSYDLSSAVSNQIWLDQVKIIPVDSEPKPSLVPTLMPTSTVALGSGALPPPPSAAVSTTTLSAGGSGSGNTFMPAFNTSTGMAAMTTTTMGAGTGTGVTNTTLSTSLLVRTPVVARG
ncbi:hypothetical protein F5Y16DRAFT_424885 [Xylariaceae sp. FL0255]|nr:hypothetical protein F5Y16DRAFT_424885 [Xylariaceae sp. FL0255]